VSGEEKEENKAWGGAVAAILGFGRAPFFFFFVVNVCFMFFF
jgi:hypothetical protein